MLISMTVELISIGTELLLGNIINTNANYLSENVPSWAFYVSPGYRRRYEARLSEASFGWIRAFRYFNSYRWPIPLLMI